MDLRLELVLDYIQAYRLIEVTNHNISQCELRTSVYKLKKNSVFFCLKPPLYGYSRTYWKMQRVTCIYYYFLYFLLLFVFVTCTTSAFPVFFFHDIYDVTYYIGLEAKYYILYQII